MAAVVESSTTLIADPLHHHLCPAPPPTDLATCKPKAQFRNYCDSDRQSLVQHTYSLMHQQQTVAFVEQQRNKWCAFNHARATILECLTQLDQLVDDSDPDIALPNSVHAYQSAEHARRYYPDLDWLHLVALIHDLGKVMALWGEPQWCVVGDTYPVGCAPDASCVFFDSFAGNADLCSDKYNSKFGIYKPNHGLDHVTMAWGHDEYMYQVLKHNGSKLPDIGLKIIRFHSFYPWHSHNAYQHLCDPDVDSETLHWVQCFNAIDLYTKSNDVPDVPAIRPYYQALIDKYIPGLLEW
jgi:inositol oxygenase